MKIWNVYDDEIRELVEEVGLRIHGDYGGNGIRRVGRAYQFRLRLGARDENGAYRFQRLGYLGRKVHGVCWHGHREFFFALYRRFPDAYVKTGVTTYMHRRHFLETYRTTMGLTCNGWQGVHQDSGCVCQQRAEPDPEPSPLAPPINYWTQIVDPPTWAVTTDFSSITNDAFVTITNTSG